MRALALQESLVVERGLQEGGRHAERGEERIRLALGVEMRDLVAAHGVGDLDTESLKVGPGVLEGGPHHVA